MDFGLKLELNAVYNFKVWFKIPLGKEGISCLDIFRFEFKVSNLTIEIRVRLYSMMLLPSLRSSICFAYILHDMRGYISMIMFT